MNIGGNEFEVSTNSYWIAILAIIVIVILFTSTTSFYKIEANEKGVVTRFGKFLKITDNGLHWKIPWNIDKVYKVKVDYRYKEEFGFRTLRAGVKSRYSEKQFSHESWMLTGDLNISDVRWIVQYNIKDPKNLLFNVRDIEGTIRNVSESAMRTAVGDRSFHEVLQSDRRRIAILTRDLMQGILDKYNIGIAIQTVELKDVRPPVPVRDSFNEVNRAKQEQETAINQANQLYNKEIFRAEGESQKIEQEALGYAINRTNRAKGDAKLFTSVFEQYIKAKDITKKRLYLETMEVVMGNVKNKYLIDKDLKGVLPLLNLQSKEVGK